jgi:hypothetical protein
VIHNPLRSEADAFRFVLIALAYFGAIAIASVLGGRWAGLGVFVILTVAAGLLILQGRREGPQRTATPPRSDSEEHRVLVIANETVGGRALREMIRERTEGRPSRVRVVSPALNSPLKHWVSDSDEARAEASKRLDASLATLRDDGIDAEGEVGDSEPLQAIEDALRTFRPDEVVISTHPEGRSNWLERGVVSGARERFTVQITHVVVDLEAEREEVR